MKINYWYRKITADSEDYSPLSDAMAYFEDQLEEARDQMELSGNLEKAIKNLPGEMDNRFSQLQEIEAILEYMNIKYLKILRERYRFYMERYNRELSSRDAEKYAEGDAEVIKVSLLKNEVALIRNQYLSIIKGLEQKSFCVSNVAKLRCAGLDDINI